MTQHCTNAWQQCTQSYHMTISRTHAHFTNSWSYCNTIKEVRCGFAVYHIYMYMVLSFPAKAYILKWLYNVNLSQTVIWSLWFRRQGVTFTHRLPSIFTYCTTSSRDYTESCISVMNVRIYPFIYITVAHTNAICVRISPKTMMLRKCWFWTQLLNIYKNKLFP